MRCEWIRNITELYCCKIRYMMLLNSLTVRPCEGPATEHELLGQQQATSSKQSEPAQQHAENAAVTYGITVLLS